MTMTGLKIAAVASGLGATLAQVDPIMTGQKLGAMAPSAILGVVCVTCVIGLVIVYRGKERDTETARKAHDEHTDKLYALIDSNTKANQVHADNAKQMSGILVEVKNAMKSCRGR